MSSSNTDLKVMDEQPERAARSHNHQMSSSNTELKAMDEQLERAARKGDIQVLGDELFTASQSDNYSSFLSVVTSSKSGRNGNIFHLAAWDGRDKFFEEAMQRLPRDVVQNLLTHHETSIRKRIQNANPLHVAASQGHLSIVELILGFYKPPAPHSNDHVPEDPPLPNNIRKPWLGQEAHGSTPLHIALENAKEECALKLLSFDMKSLVNLNDHRCKSVLYVAVKYGCSKVAKEILTSIHPYTFTGNKGQTPLHFAPKCSDEEVCKLLVEKHPQLIKTINMKGNTILHQWLKIGKFWPFEYLIKNDDIAPDSKRDLISLIDLASTPSQQRKKKKDVGIRPVRIDKTPLLVALDKGNVEATCNLVEAYQQERANQASSNSLQDPLPWLRRNKDGKTPLDLAILENKEEIALCFLSPEINFVLQGLDNPLFLAIEKKCYTVAKGILDIQTQHGWSIGLSSDRGRNVLHGAKNYKQEVATWLVEQLPPDFISKKDDDGMTPLHEASEAGLAWLVEVMLKRDPSALANAPLAWVEPCKRGHFSTVLAFTEHCPNLRDVCLQLQDTPLHHIKLGGYTSYQKFLKTPIFEELKYTQDSHGATPLHRAIMNNNIELADALLYINWIDGRIKDESGKTAMDLLAAACTQDQKWEKMCKRLRINLELKMTYAQQEKNLLDMRGNLLAVAALLATITFTAGFTLPGGLNNDDNSTGRGEAILAKKAAFLTFLIADTYAMCCSMLVLFCLICSMVYEREKSLSWIKRSKVILTQSLYGTMVAFMAGIFAVISDKSLWASILVIVMCCLVAIAILLYKLLDKMFPVVNGERWIQNLLLKMGNACRFWGRTRSPRTTASNV